MSVRRVLVFPVMVALAFGVVVRSAPQMPAQSAPAAPKGLSGNWELSFDGRKVPPSKLLASVTPAKIEQHAKLDAHAIRWCNLMGMPFVMDSGRPIDIREGPTVVMIVAENVPNPRYLYLNRQHISPDIWDPNTGGDSIAHWDGDTLVVDTVGFHPTHGVTAIPGGGYRTDKSHLVERFRLLENGSVLSVTSTWTDPTMFAEPHTYEFRYSRLPDTYEARAGLGCDPYDQARADFLGDPLEKPAPKPAAPKASTAPAPKAGAAAAPAGRSTGANGSGR
jgi:hypothetical protein